MDFHLKLWVSFAYLFIAASTAGLLYGVFKREDEKTRWQSTQRPGGGLPRITLQRPPPNKTDRGARIFAACLIGALWPLALIMRILARVWR